MRCKSKGSERDREVFKETPDMILAKAMKGIVEVRLHLIQRENNERKEQPLKKLSKPQSEPQHLDTVDFVRDVVRDV